MKATDSPSRSDGKTPISDARMKLLRAVTGHAPSRPARTNGAGFPFSNASVQQTSVQQPSLQPTRIDSRRSDIFKVKLDSEL
jgi:hypothetical protein